MNRPLTTKQFKFKEAIIRGLSGIDAAREAGYKGNGNVLYVMANKLVSNGKIKEAIDKHKAEIEAKAEYGLPKWRQDMITARASAAESKQWSAVAAFDRLLGQHLGGFEADNEQKAEQRQLSEREQVYAKVISDYTLKVGVA